jgi:hypothetical protein
MGTPTPLPQIADRFKRALIAETAMRLNSAHGRRKMYSAGEVTEAMGKANFPAGWAGWAVAVFCTGPEFDAYCAEKNVVADYTATREIAVRFIDKPIPPPPGTAGAASNAGAGVKSSGALSAGAVAAGTLVAGATLAAGAAPLDDTDPNRSVLGDLTDMAETTLDVADAAGGIFDLLGIFD